ncbi:MAG: hypothetical protein AAGC85_19590 [Bacteroidota bacterium]
MINLTSSSRWMLSPVNILFWLFFLACTLAGSAQAEFPGYKEAWPKATPESQGMSSEILEKAQSTIRTDGGADFSIIDMIILRNGKDVWYIGNPYNQYKGTLIQKDWASCGRSFMATMFGMLFYENDMDISVMEQPVNKTFNSYIGKAMDEDITVKHLLGYTSCSNPPGSEWQYACNYFKMYKILRDVDGKTPDDRLAKLASLIDADWEPYHTWLHKQDVPFLTIVATPAEAARWGYLWLHKGNWNGTQIVDSAFVDYSILPTKSPLGGYAHPNEGLQIHLNYEGMWGDVIPKDAYAAFGAGGRIIFVCPSLNLVCASITYPSAYQKQEKDGYIVRDIRNLFEPIVQSVIK